MVKIYGSSDDLVCLDNSNYAEDEIACYDVAGVWLFLEDDTVLFVHYMDGIWRIDIEQEGSMPYEHGVCTGTDDDDYSDVFLTESDVVNHEIAYK